MTVVFSADARDFALRAWSTLVTADPGGPAPPRGAGVRGGGRGAGGGGRVRAVRADIALPRRDRGDRLPRAGRARGVPARDRQGAARRARPARGLVRGRSARPARGPALAHSASRGGRGPGPDRRGAR